MNFGGVSCQDITEKMRAIHEGFNEFSKTNVDVDCSTLKEQTRAMKIAEEMSRAINHDFSESERVEIVSLIKHNVIDYLHKRHEDEDNEFRKFKEETIRRLKEQAENLEILKSI